MVTLISIPTWWWPTWSTEKTVAGARVTSAGCGPTGRRPARRTNHICGPDSRPASVSDGPTGRAAGPRCKGSRRCSWVNFRHGRPIFDDTWRGGDPTVGAVPGWPGRPPGHRRHQVSPLPSWLLIGSDARGRWGNRARTWRRTRADGWTPCPGG